MENMTTQSMTDEFEIDFSEQEKKLKTSAELNEDGNLEFEDKLFKKYQEKTNQVVKKVIEK